jgi:hypothetical protein
VEEPLRKLCKTSHSGGVHLWGWHWLCPLVPEEPVQENVLALRACFFVPGKVCLNRLLLIIPGCGAIAWHLYPVLFSRFSKTALYCSPDAHRFVGNSSLSFSVATNPPQKHWQYFPIYIYIYIYTVSLYIYIYIYTLFLCAGFPVSCSLAILWNCCFPLSFSQAALPYQLLVLVLLGTILAFLFYSSWLECPYKLVILTQLAMCE